MFDGVTLSNANYDNLLIGWNTQTLQSGVTFHGGNSQYCLGETARANMIANDSWTITDGGSTGGAGCSPFVMTIKTDNPGTSNNMQFTIPVLGTTPNYNVDWGDNSTSAGVAGNITHTYATPGTYVVSITGDFYQIFYDSTSDNNKILSIDQWGSIAWNSFERAFSGCSNLQILASDIPDLSGVTNMSFMFKGCSVLSSGIFNSWDTSNVTDMREMFNGAALFNLSLIHI